eukprot:403333046
MNTVKTFEIDYAPFKMAQFEFEGKNFLIVSGNDAQLHIYQIELNPLSEELMITDAISQFFKTGKCEFDSDVLHIHVDNVNSSLCLIAIATEFGQIKVFEVKNKTRRTKFGQTKSEFREFFSGNISSNICKIQLFLTESDIPQDPEQEQEEQIETDFDKEDTLEQKNPVAQKNSRDFFGLDSYQDDMERFSPAPKKRRHSFTYQKSSLIMDDKEEKHETQNKRGSVNSNRRSQELKKDKYEDLMYNPNSNYKMNLLVTTNYGYNIVYHDITHRQFELMTLLPLLKGKQDLAAACEVLDFDLELERESFNIVLGLYSQYLVRYSEKKQIDNQQEGLHYELKDAMFLDHPIMAISKGDIFDIGIYYMIVITSGSVWVIGPKAMERVYRQLYQ